MKKGTIVNYKLTNEKVMVLGTIEDMGFLIRLPNYAEIAVRDFEIEEIKEEKSNE